MSTPNPVPPAEPAAPGFAPSNSTVGSTIGGAIAALVMYGLGAKGITFPAGAEAALATLLAVLAGYLPAAGRK